MRARFVLTFLAFHLCLSACGGNSSPTENPSQGIFVDAVVGGLSFQTLSQSGVTDANGVFSFSPGETVRFFLGDLILGEAPARDTLYPTDLFPGLDTTDPHFFNRFRGDLGKTHVTSADRVRNVAVFLQSLDDDGNLENGIAVPPAVSELLRGTDLSFERKSQEFRQETGLLELRRDGFAQGLWGGAKALVSEGRALDHLFASLNPSPPMFRETVAISESGGIPQSLRRNSYDAEGRLVGQEVDLLNDGSIDSVTTITYNEFDGIVRFESDNLNDALPKTVSTSEYDVRGNIVRSLQDSNDDGVPEGVSRYFYDELDRRIRFETDGTDAGEEADFIQSMFYDERGNLVRLEQDSNGDGTAETVSQSEYDEQRRRIRFEEDSDVDGAPDRINTREFDAGGKLAREFDDSDGDGDFETVSTNEYDANGNLIRSERAFAPSGTSQVTSLTYDASGNIIEFAFDNNGDGTPESISRNAFDENGNLIRNEQDGDADGDADASSTIQYEPGGFLSVFTSNLG